MNKPNTELLLKAAELASLLPEWAFWNIDFNGMERQNLEIQAASQEKARELRQVLLIPHWKKEFSQSLNWWEWIAEIGELRVRIYACKEAPPTCKLIEEEYTTTERVPVAFEEREVVKTRKRWDCTPSEVEA